jgi:hypothetical protein
VFHESPRRLLFAAQCGMGPGRRRAKSVAKSVDAVFLHAVRRPLSHPLMHFVC